MPERSGKLLLIILCLLPCSVTSFECSLSREKALLSLSCPCFCRNASNQFSIGSAECKSGLSTEVHPAYMLGPGLGSLVFIIVDLAPLIVYFPALIIFNINLASGPAQSFLFFYHALSAALSAAIGSKLPFIKSYSHFWAWLTMQSPINDVLFPRTLPYIALQYCKLPAVYVGGHSHDPSAGQMYPLPMCLLASSLGKASSICSKFSGKECPEGDSVEWIV